MTDTEAEGLASDSENEVAIKRISNYAKRGCFVISAFTILGYLMQKRKKKHKKVCLDTK